MRKIGKASTVLFTALLAALVLMPMVNQANASIVKLIWSDYAYKGYDSYYGDYVIAYVNGTTAKLKVPIYNDFSSPSMNITAVSLVFDTGYNITLSTVVNVTYGATHYFDFSFTADTNVLSNLWSHTYKVVADLQDNSGWKYEDYWTYYSSYYGYNFVVYLPEQKDVKDLSTKYSAYYSSYPPSSFETVGAHMLVTQAIVESSLAQNYINLGNFTEAKAHMQNAVSYYEQALDAEEEKGTAIEDANLNATLTEAEADMKQADAAMLTAQAIMNQSYGYILFGLGFIIMGIGVVIYAAKKPKTS